MAYVRKENEKSHGTEIENDIPSRGYGVTDKMVGVFVDDFVDSGETFKRCKHKVNTLGLDIVATYVTKMNVFNPRPNEKGK
jgi:hypoxanthine phosphoribosyltransferase